MFKQYDPQTARQTILKRTPPDEFPVSQRVLDGIAGLFGERLTPDEAVSKILKDVRRNGDAALQTWTRTLDNLDLKPAPVSKDVVQAALDSISAVQRDALEKAAARIEKQEPGRQAAGASRPVARGVEPDLREPALQQVGPVGADRDSAG